MLIYQDRQTVVHGLHPLAKLVGLSAICGCAISFNHPLYLFALAGPVIVTGLAGRSLGVLRRVWKLMVILFLFSTILWTLLLPGEDVAATMGPFQVHGRPLLFGLAMGLRFNVILMAGVFFVATTRVEDFTRALCLIGLPYRVSFALSLAFRLVPMFMESAMTIAQAQRCRGLDLDSGSLLARTRRYLPLLVPVFMMAIRSADNLAMALESRAFGSALPRTSLQSHALKPRDMAAMAASAGLFALCLILRMAGYGGL